MPNNLPTDELEAAKARARLAMEGPARAAKEAEEDKAMIEKRKAAAFAMEGVERRTKREAKERELREKQAMLARIDEEVKQREADAAKKKADAEAARANEAAEKEHVIAQKEAAYAESQSAIEKLKEDRGSTLKAIHTLQSDLAEAVKAEKITAESIVLAKQDHPTEAQKPAAATADSGGMGLIVFIILLLAFLLLGGAGAYWYYKVRPTATVSATVPAIKSIISAEGSHEFKTGNTASSSLAQEINSLLAAPAPAGELIVNAYFTKIVPATTEGAAAHAEQLDFPAWQVYAAPAIPADFARFVSDYMLAIYRQSGDGSSTGSIFLTLKVDPYDIVYQTLLDHEDSWVRQIFQKLDGQELTASAENQKFTDYLLKNLNTRVLRDPSNKTVMIYTFFDQKTLVFAQTEDALYHAYVVYKTQRPN